MNVTAQVFREAADDLSQIADDYFRNKYQGLLLAAAEQREQLDSLKAELIDAHHRIMELEMPPTDYTLLPLLGKKPNE